MKRLFIIIVSVLLVMSISTSAFAHSHLGGSSPADGEVVTEPLTEIILEFDGQIEQGSYIDVTTTEGQAIELQEIIIEEDTLTGEVAQPLSNDEYRVNWNIISADGHPLEGEFSFTVDAEVQEIAEEETVEPTETEEGTESESTEEETENQASTISADDGEQGASSVTIVLVGLIVILVIGAFFLFRKKGK